MCKKILIPEENQYEHLRNAMKEFEILLSVDHPCICKLYGINTNELLRIENNEEITTVALFLEYLDFDLNDCIQKGFLTNTLKAQIAIEIVHGMNYIHKKGLIHRDLKTENIRLSSDLRAKIVDLGLAKINDVLVPSYSYSQGSIIKNLGNAIYMSPELLNEEKLDNKTDVYSFGVLLLNLFEGKLPKYSMKDKMERKEIPLPCQSSSISEFCIDLISRCLSIDPESRPSFDNIINQIRLNEYNLAPDIDASFLSKYDKELTIFNQ